MKTIAAILLAVVLALPVVAGDGNPISISITTTNNGQYQYYHIPTNQVWIIKSVGVVCTNAATGSFSINLYRGSNKMPTLYADTLTSGTNAVDTDCAGRMLFGNLSDKIGVDATGLSQNAVIYIDAEGK